MSQFEGFRVGARSAILVDNLEVVRSGEWRLILAFY